MPLDVSPSLPLPQRLDDTGVPAIAAAGKGRPVYHPTAIAQYALAAWNTFLATGAERHRQAFMTQVSWLREHEARLNTGAGVWLVPRDARTHPAPQEALSALTQGVVLSVFTRAYRLTGEEAFLHAARRAARPFLEDILDGGVSAPVGDDGLFFEEDAEYPAAHVLAGHLFALLGLHDYATFTDEPEIAAIIERGHATLHGLFEEYDAKFWSRGDLLHRTLATPLAHALHVALLEAVGQALSCERCARQAQQWAARQRRLSSRLRYSLSSGNARMRSALGRTIRRALFGKPNTSERMARDLVCVPITAFPVAGGMRSVLAGVASAMADVWEIEYLTFRVGPHAEGLTIHAFGSERTSPWRFPNVWLYAFAGWRKLTQLLRQGHRYRLIIPQDGAYTGAFSAAVARLAGVRVLCMDHGNVTLPDSAIYHTERKQRRMAKPGPRRLFLHLRDACYYPSLRLLVRIATRYTDTFLPAGDDVANAYIQHHEVHPSQIVRYPFLIDTERFAPLDGTARVEARAKLGISSDAIVIAMVNRLAPEKGLDVAIAGLSQALAALPAEMRARVCMIVAGEGGLRNQVEADIRERNLESTCRLWGEATRKEVGMLLGICDIFLHTGTRGINPVALLEAMAAGCGVISTVAPQVVARYLAEGRGIAVSIGDVDAIASALARTITDLPLCRNMGRLAREYIATHHTATALRRALLRAAFWAPNIERLRDATPNAADAVSAEQSGYPAGNR
jgi:glycosyltransferase involved in cell wall biosynthesis